jgi:hypothetical protein
VSNDVFEMFWDCGFCRAKQLLGRTHRFCPNCGAQQDAAWRYFPPAGLEVPASAEYSGADKECPTCKLPSGAKANNCSNCGCPLDGAAEVKRVQDNPAPEPPPRVRKLGWVKWGVIGLIATCVLVVLLAIFWKKEVSSTVLSHSWKRQIDIEMFKPVSESAWCDSKPSDAYSVTSHREQRSTRSVPDGEECSTKNVDRGDGTFERREECHTKYRDEPVYDQKCYYTVNRWRVAHTIEASGLGMAPAPAWPPVVLNSHGSTLGSEREGARRATYLLHLRGADSKSYECAVDEARWHAIGDKQVKPLKVGVLTDKPNCADL